MSANSRCLASRRERKQKIKTPDCDEHAECAAEARDEQAFRQQLAHDSPAGGAKCGTSCQFVTTARAACEQEAGKVGTGDEQDEAHGAQHGPER